MTLTDLQVAGLIICMCSVAAFIAMHFAKTMFDRMALLYAATGLGIVATVIGILT